MNNKEATPTTTALSPSTITATAAGPLALARTRIAAHPDPLKPCYINDLVAVELQSCMHFLTTSELLRFARTQKKIQSAAASSGAWRHQPTLQLDLRLGWYQGSRIRSSLLQYSPAGLRLEAHLGPHEFEDTREIDESDLAELIAIPYVKIASINALRISEAQWRRLLTGLTTNQVQELYLTIGPSFDSSEMSHMSSLTRLRIDHDSIDDGEDGVSEAEVQSLHLIPNLTALALSDIFHTSKRRSCTYAIEKCTHLKELHLSQPHLRGTRFREFFTSPHLSRLERLIIFGDWDSQRKGKRVISKSDFFAVFSSMHSLRLLSLEWSPCVGDLIAGLIVAAVNATFTATSSDPMILSLMVDYEIPKLCVTSIQQLLKATVEKENIQVQLRGIGRHRVKEYFTKEEQTRITSREDTPEFGQWEDSSAEREEEEEEADFEEEDYEEDGQDQDEEDEDEEDEEYQDEEDHEDESSKGPPVLRKKSNVITLRR